MRVARVVSHLRQTCSGYKVLLVCHGNIMWGFRITLEKYVFWLRKPDSSSLAKRALISLPFRCALASSRPNSSA
jgi:broad specificity phosphatase PhoE